MDDKELALAQIRQINAAAFKEESEARKLKYEVDQAIAENKLPFYQRAWFIKSAVAGILIFTFLIGYVELIFLPAQKKLRNETDSAVYRLQQKEAKFSAEKARLELLLEQAKLEKMKAISENESAEIQLDQAKNSIKNLESILSGLDSDSKKTKEIAEAKNVINEELKNIESAQQSVALQSNRLKKISAEIGGVGKEDIVQHGWIYLGHFPDKTWGHKNIEIDIAKEPELNKPYILVQDINIRNHAPRFSFSGYKFGAIIGNLSAGQKIEIIKKPKKVGFSKIWAEIKVLSE